MAASLEKLLKGEARTGPEQGSIGYQELSHPLHGPYSQSSHTMWLKGSWCPILILGSQPIWDPSTSLPIKGPMYSLFQMQF